tara:strand:+ start:212 stop:580 length:369 start_codon:yes stop_codon:yes gene_type:complete
MKDDNYLIKVEKAIEDKYGEETIQNPRSNWSPQKEKEYLRQIKEAYKLQKPREKVEVNGVLMPKKLFNKESERTCPVCEVYTQYSQDDLYLTKFKCCYRCYIQHVEGREEKWLNSLKKNSEK